MKILFIKISIFFSLILLNSCDKSYLDLTKKNNSFEKESFHLLSYEETPRLIISGPFLKSDKIKASKILAKILCRNENLKVNHDKYLSIENQFKKEISEVSLEEGIEKSPQVIKTGIELKEYLIENCTKLIISKRDEQDIYSKNFRFNK
tara:strand:- start:6 stop:452 length:447 start_codon:yes stop_codon:yes gene_type:complete